MKTADSGTHEHDFKVCEHGLFDHCHYGPLYCLCGVSTIEAGIENETGGIRTKPYRKE